MGIKKEFIPFIVGLGIVFLNVPIVILLSVLKPEFIESVVAIVVPIECILMGLTMIYSELQGRKNNRNDYNVCEGVIKDTEFKLLNSNWIKAPVVSYVVNKKKYETIANFGINGIFIFFIKGLRVKVYYKKDNPQIATFNNYTPIIVGALFIIAAISIFFI